MFGAGLLKSSPPPALSASQVFPMRHSAVPVLQSLQDGHACSPTQNCKLLKKYFLHIFNSIMFFVNNVVSQHTKGRNPKCLPKSVPDDKRGVTGLLLCYHQPVSALSICISFHVEAESWASLEQGLLARTRVAT